MSQRLAMTQARRCRESSVISRWTRKDSKVLYQPRSSVGVVDTRKGDATNNVAVDNYLRRLCGIH